MQDVIVHGVESAHVSLPVLGKSGDYFIRGRREVLFHHVDKRRARPVRVSFTQKVRDLDGVLLPLVVGLLLCRLVSCLRGLDQIDGDRDVLFSRLVSCLPAAAP
jgi:hypothetical protein